MKTQLAVLLCAVTFQACAGITINATRVVYSGKEKVASLNIHNRSSTPYKVQIWLDAGLNTSRIGLPIVATPPQVYLSPQQSAQLRFIYLGGGLPGDRESVYWVNIQETPPAAVGTHTLQFVVRTRLKLFYRPPAITTTLTREVQKLQWQQSGNNLRFTNLGPLHITLVNGALIDNKGHLSPIRNVMLRPYSSHTVMTTDSTRLYQLNYIDDYGAVVPIPLQNAHVPPRLVILQGESHHAVGRTGSHRGVSLHILGVEIDRLGGTGAGAGHPFQDRQVAGLIDLNAGAVGHCRTGVIAVGQLHADAAGAVAGLAQGQGIALHADAEKPMRTSVGVGQKTGIEKRFA